MVLRGALVRRLSYIMSTVTWSAVVRIRLDQNRKTQPAGQYGHLHSIHRASHCWRALPPTFGRLLLSVPISLAPHCAPLPTQLLENADNGAIILPVSALRSHCVSGTHQGRVVCVEQCSPVAASRHGPPPIHRNMVRARHRKRCAIPSTPPFMQFKPRQPRHEVHLAGPGIA
jgi:hypothetical protein